MGSMKAFLMNKAKEVLLAEYNETSKFFDRIYEIYDIRYAPYLLKNFYGIKDAREKLENMYILDFLILNEDRHLGNFGIIRDVNTLEWLDVAPIFDNGQILQIVSYDEKE